jgi:hypothetical protein
MQPAVVALAIALYLFSFAYRLQPPLLYAALILSTIVLVYGLLSKDLPVEPFKDDEETEEEDEGGLSLFHK